MFARHRGNRRDPSHGTNSRPEGELLADISKQTLSSTRQRITGTSVTGCYPRKWDRLGHRGNRVGLGFGAGVEWVVPVVFEVLVVGGLTHLGPTFAVITSRSLGSAAHARSLGVP